MKSSMNQAIRYKIQTIALLLVVSNIYTQNIIIKPYLQDLKHNEITIMWEADNSGKGYVDYGDSPFTLNQTTISNDANGNGNSRIHTAVINGLSPNTKYYYKTRMLSGTQSNIYHFYTLPTSNTNSSTELVAVSDMQRDGGNPDVFKTLVEQGIVTVCDTIMENGFNDLEGILISWRFSAKRWKL